MMSSTVAGDMEIGGSAEATAIVEIGGSAEATAIGRGRALDSQARLGRSAQHSCENPRILAKDILAKDHVSIFPFRCLSRYHRPPSPPCLYSLSTSVTPTTRPCVDERLQVFHSIDLSDPPTGIAGVCGRETKKLILPVTLVRIS
jgi:hypothetical protein